MTGLARLTLSLHDEQGLVVDTDRLRDVARRAAAGEGATGEISITLVDAHRIAELNARYLGGEGPTDVLSFPVDGGGVPVGPRELGDVVIAPEHTTDLREAVVHGALHLAGMDHENDEGEMLALQRQLLTW